MELPLPTVVLKTCGSLPRKQSPAHSVAFRSVSELGETKAACWSHSNPTVTGCFPPEEGRTEEVESRQREQQSGAPLGVFWGEGAPRPGRQLWSAPVHGWKVPIALLYAAQCGPTNTCSAARFTPKLKLPDLPGTAGHHHHSELCLLKPTWPLPKSFQGWVVYQV